MSIGETRISTGRGGAGNIGSPTLLPKKHAKDEQFETPSLTSKEYTTGRGGQGNMAKNEGPASTRKAQDVDPVRRREYMPGSSVSTGRGGGGNMVREGATSPNKITTLEGVEKDDFYGNGREGVDVLKQSRKEREAEAERTRRVSPSGSVAAGSAASGSISPPPPGARLGERRRTGTNGRGSFVDEAKRLAGRVMGGSKSLSPRLGPRRDTS